MGIVSGSEIDESSSWLATSFTALRAGVSLDRFLKPKAKRPWALAFVTICRTHYPVVPIFYFYFFPGYMAF